MISGKERKAKGCWGANETDHAASSAAGISGRLVGRVTKAGLLEALGAVGAAVGASRNNLDITRGYYASEMSQTEKDKYSMLSLICGI